MVRDTPTPSGIAGVFLENRERLVRFFTSRLRDPADAEEIVQEIFVRLGTVSAGPIADPLSYLHRIGLNLVVDRMRERDRRAKRERDWSDARTSYLGEEAVDESPSAFDELAHRERQERFERTLASMPPGAARVFRMHRIEELSHRDISERLGISRKGVEKHMSVALRHLAKEFVE
jgi:RNA polymerase sigma-70 factor (ECF subfamily)